MANVEFRYASGPVARYLDVSPMISALRFQPDDFEFKHGWLRYVPSRHHFQFDKLGRVTIDALCACASLSVRPRTDRRTGLDVQDLAQGILEAAGDEPRVRFALPQTQRLGAAVLGRADGIPAVPAPRRAGQHSSRRPGDSARHAGGIANDIGLSVGRAARVATRRRGVSCVLSPPLPPGGGSPPNLAACAVEKPKTGPSGLALDRVDTPGMLSSKPSGALGPPMSVRTQPGAILRSPWCRPDLRAAKLRFIMLSAALLAR